MNAQYATCYLCDELVYLFKKQFARTSASAAALYRKRMAIVRCGVVLCQRCSSALHGGDGPDRR